MIEREQLEMDVIFVGAGPANLAAALHLKNLIKEHDELVAKGRRTGKQIGELEIGIIEKAPTSERIFCPARSLTRLLCAN